MNTYVRKYVRLVLISMVPVISGLLITLPLAHASGDKVKGEVKEAAAAIGEYSIEQKDAAVAKAKEMMKKIDGQIDSWEGRMHGNWAEMKQSSRDNYEKSLKNIRRQRNELSEWYGSMKQSSKEAWGDVKQGFANAYDSLANSYHDSEKEMKTDQ